MKEYELTASVTALAELLACKLPEDDLLILAAVLVQLGDTLTTILAYRDIQNKPTQNS